MKRIFIATVLILLLAAPVFASGDIDCSHPLADLLLNDCVDHPVAKRRTEVGVGADILLKEFDEADLVGEYKYDWQNGEQGAYVVVKTKKSLWDLVVGLFKKGEE